MPPVDLGKAHIKILLSDEIPGVTRDVEKMRKSGTLTVGMDSPRMQNNGAYGVMDIAMQGESENRLATAVMPVPLFEPVSNYYVDKTNRPDEATTDVYWTDIPFKNISRIFKQRVLEQNTKAELEGNLQRWKTTTETVEPLRFSDVEYKQTNIGYEGKGYQTEAQKKSEKESKDADGNTVQSTGSTHTTLTQLPGGTILIEEENDPVPEVPDDKAEAANETTETTKRPVEPPETSEFARQYESLPSVWWGLQSEYFKEPSWPFWVVIKTHSINLRKGKDKSALLSIRIRDAQHEPDVAGKRANPDNQLLVKNIELIVDTNGTSTLHWQIQETRDGENDVKKTQSFNEPIDLPEISESFREKGEIRIGFIPVLGRLCIFSNPSSYEVVQFTSSDQKRLVTYGLNNTAVTIQGYGCTASIQAFPMTFFHKAWVSLADKIPIGDDNVKGYRFPSSDQGNVKAGSLGNGCFICSPISIKEHRDNKGRLKYSGSFREYKEVLLDASESVNSTRESKCTITLGDKDVGYYGLVNAWGQLHVVRHGKDEFFNEPFWFAYFGTARLKKQQIIPGESKEDREDADRELKSAGNVGFPYLVAIRSVQPKQPDRRQYDVQASGGSTEIISDDVTQLSVTSELDAVYKPTFVQRSGSFTVFNRDGDYTRFLSRARGVKIWAKWDQDDTTSFTDNDIIFSGIAYGRNSSVSPGEQYVTFSCVDHWTVMENFRIKNSPYYDGFEVTAVMEDITERCGMEFQDDIDRSQAQQNGPAWYFLGSGLRIFDQPKYRFNHSSPLKDCLVEVVKNFEVYMFFDNDGILHVAPIPGGFTWDKTNPLWNVSVKATYFQKMDGLSDEKRLIVDSFEINSSLAEGFHNVFLITGIERVWSRPILMANSNPDSLTKPDQIGYLGYISEFEEVRPDLNSEEAVGAYLAGTIKRLYSRPGFETTFKTIGHIPPYIPGEFIRVEDDPTGGLSETLVNKFRVTRIEQSYNAGSNDWTTSIGGFQVTPAESNITGA